MQLNGAIDRDLYGIDTKADILSISEKEIDIKGCCAFAVTNLGNVPVIINGNIKIGVGSCNTRSFPNYLLLDYVRNFDLDWLDEGINSPDPRIELIRVYIVKKETDLSAE